MNQERGCGIVECPAYRQSPSQSIRNAKIDLKGYILLRQKRPPTSDEKPTGSCAVLSGKNEEVVVERGAKCGVGNERYKRWYDAWKKGVFSP